MNIYLTDPKNGEKSVSLTIAVTAFVACLLKFVCNDVKFGTFDFGVVDPTLLGALLVPTLGLYFGRKLTDSNKDSTTKQGE